MASVENRGGGSWLVTVYSGYRPDGSQKKTRRMFHANPNSTENAQRKQAEKYAGRLQAEYDDKKIADKKKLSFDKVYEEYSEYLDDLVFSGDMAQQTADSYKKLFDLRLSKAFGKTAIREIETSDVDRFLRQLAKSGKDGERLSGTYRLKYYQQLNELFLFAKRLKYISVNPCDDAIKPKRDTQEAQFYELEECVEIEKQIAAWSDPRWRAYFSIAFYCGCRPGELIGLNWSDYDGTNIHIQAGSYQRKGEKNHRTDKPKTKKSVRIIQLAPEAIKALDAWKSVQAQQRLKCGSCWQDPGAVFTNEEGVRISSGRPSRVWKTFTKENNLRHLPPYGLRHTNCSVLIHSRELSVEEIATRMGHEQTSTTVNFYSHAFASANERTTKAFGNVLKQAANGNLK